MKKFATVALSVGLIGAMVAGGSLAYLSDTASDVNVMTLGKVEIEQHEYERVVDANGEYETKEIDGVNSYVLKNFTQGKELLPIVGDPSTGAAGWDATTVRMSQVDSYGGMDVFAGKNAQDKFVTVENTGKTDAYVRTLVAIEVGSAGKDLIGTSYHQTWTKNEIGTIEIDGNNYVVTEYVYAGGQLDANNWRHKDGILPAGDTSYPNLSQVYLKSVANNDDMKAIDGNSNGTLDILVLSQAVQAEGFDNAQTALDTAFGKTSEKAAEWFSGMKAPVMVGEGEDLTDAVANGDNIILTKNVSTDKDLTVTSDKTVKIDGQGKELTAPYFKNQGTAIVENVTMKAGSATDYSNISEGADAVTTYNDVEIVSAGGGIGAAGGAKVVFNSGSIYIDSDSTSGRYVFYTEGAGSEITINGGTFSWDPTDNQKRAYIYAGAGTTVYVKGGTFGKASTRSGYTAGILGEGTVIITGGTFGFDPTTWVADGYQAVKDGNTWTVSAK